MPPAPWPPSRRIAVGALRRPRQRGDPASVRPEPGFPLPVRTLRYAPRYGQWALLAQAARRGGVDVRDDGDGEPVAAGPVVPGRRDVQLGLARRQLPHLHRLEVPLPDVRPAVTGRSSRTRMTAGSIGGCCSSSPASSGERHASATRMAGQAGITGRRRCRRWCRGKRPANGTGGRFDELARRRTSQGSTAVAERSLGDDVSASRHRCPGDQLHRSHGPADADPAVRIADRRADLRTIRRRAERREPPVSCLRKIGRLPPLGSFFSERSTEIARAHRLGKQTSSAVQRHLAPRLSPDRRPRRRRSRPSRPAPSPGPGGGETQSANHHPWCASSAGPAISTSTT